MTEQSRLLAALRRAVESSLRPLLSGPGPLALIDFPSHSNVGDSAIWLGELACLRALGVSRLCYSCDLETYDRDHLAVRLGGGTILLHGGGNLGDLYAPHQRFRETVVQNFPNNPIIQLPQSIHFQSREALQRARAIFDRHPNFTLLVREHRSLEHARNEFRARTVLCPDMAFCLGELERPVPASQPVLWLIRTDKEAVAGVSAEMTLGQHRDWLEQRDTVLADTNRWLSRRVAKRNRVGRVLRGAVSATYAPLARRRLERGCRLLSTARTVVTDRLHGHILCLLLGIPHVVMDNSYGKVSSFYETWTADSQLARLSSSPSEAAALATGPDWAGG